MSAVQFFTRADLERKLRPYRCRLMEALLHLRGMKRRLRSAYRAISRPN